MQWTLYFFCKEASVWLCCPSVSPVFVCKSTKSPLRTFRPEEGWAMVITLALHCHKFAPHCEALQKPALSPTQKIYYWDVRRSSSRSPVGLLCASTLFIRSALLLCPLHRDAHESNQEIRGNKPGPLCSPGLVSRGSACVLLFACVVTTDYEWFSSSRSVVIYPNGQKSFLLGKHIRSI